jgi:hypothetical protein
VRVLLLALTSCCLRSPPAVCAHLLPLALTSCCLYSPPAACARFLCSTNLPNVSPCQKLSNSYLSLLGRRVQLCGGIGSDRTSVRADGFAASGGGRRRWTAVRGVDARRERALMCPGLPKVFTRDVPVSSQDLLVGSVARRRCRPKQISALLFHVQRTAAYNR